MFTRDNISRSSQHFLDNTGHTIMDLFNNVLTEKGDIEQLIKENNVPTVSSSLPGLIIQAYLVLVRLFDLNVMEPVAGVCQTSVEGATVKVEQIIEEIVDIDDVEADDAEPSVLTGDTGSVDVSVFGDTTYSSDEADFFLDGTVGAVPMKRDKTGQKRKIASEEKVECDFCHKHFTRSYIHKHRLSNGISPSTHEFTVLILLSQ